MINRNKHEFEYPLKKTGRLNLNLLERNDRRYLNDCQSTFQLASRKCTYFGILSLVAIFVFADWVSKVEDLMAPHIATITSVVTCLIISQSGRFYTSYLKIWKPFCAFFTCQKSHSFQALWTPCLVGWIWLGVIYKLRNRGKEGVYKYYIGGRGLPRPQKWLRNIWMTPYCSCGPLTCANFHCTQYCSMSFLTNHCVCHLYIYVTKNWVMKQSFTKHGTLRSSFAKHN